LRPSADINGCDILTEYLRNFQDHNKMLSPNRAHSFHQFYTYYTIQMRQIIPKRALKAQLNTNGAEASYAGSDEFGKYIQSETQKWQKVIEKSKVSID
jgi:hypothetical protein